ncbi:MAG: PD-(D/E)XK nuclease family protein [Nitrospirae bacterium]|nr:MAG: PD-(D/E)XK nuclease family protein [Nitrospirota bacterium]
MPAIAAILDAPEAPDVFGDEGERPGDILSPSQVTTWMSCQMKWAFAKVWGLREPGTAASAFGHAVHEATAEAHRCQMETGAVLPVEAAIAAFSTAWTREVSTAKLTPRHDPEELRGRGAKLVERYMREIAPTLDPAAAEVALPADAAIGGVRVRGRIDVVEHDGRVRDTKTCCTKPQGMRAKDRIQVTVYAMALPGASGHVAVDYLVKTKGRPQLVQIEDRISHGDELLVQELLKKAQAGMRGGNYSPSRLASCCNRLMCGYADLCESEFGGRVPFYPEAS